LYRVKVATSVTSEVESFAQEVDTDQDVVNTQAQVAQDLRPSSECTFDDVLDLDVEVLR